MYENLYFPNTKITSLSNKHHPKWRIVIFGANLHSQHINYYNILPISTSRFLNTKRVGSAVIEVVIELAYLHVQCVINYRSVESTRY